MPVPRFFFQIPNASSPPRHNSNCPGLVDDVLVHVEVVVLLMDVVEVVVVLVVVVVVQVVGNVGHDAATSGSRSGHKFGNLILTTACSLALDSVKRSL